MMMGISTKRPLLGTLECLNLYMEGYYILTIIYFHVWLSLKNLSINHMSLGWFSIYSYYKMLFGVTSWCNCSIGDSKVGAEESLRHSYGKSFRGFAAMLSPSHVQQLKSKLISNDLSTQLRFKIIKNRYEWQTFASTYIYFLQTVHVDLFSVNYRYGWRNLCVWEQEAETLNDQIMGFHRLSYICSN